MLIEPKEYRSSIVLIGHFNPLIFRPHWFAANGLIGSEEAMNAEVEVTHKEIVIFSLEWVKITVDRDRFVADFVGGRDVRGWDLVVKTFKEFLQHTPIQKMGINNSVHFSVADQDVMDRIGDTLAPKEPWGEWKDTLEKAKKGKTRSGMRSLTMQQSIRDDGWQGHIHARVEPSVKHFPGISVTVNDHYAIEDTDVEGCAEIISCLEENWSKSMDRSEWIVDQVMALA